MPTLCPTCQSAVDLPASGCAACGQVTLTATIDGSAAPTVTSGSTEAAPPASIIYGYSSPATSRGRGTGRVPLSNVQPVWQYLLLQICSFGLYDLFWLFLTWRLLKERHRLYITPAARALFPMFFPISLCKEIHKLSTSVDHKPTWQPAVIGSLYLVFEVLSGIGMRQDAVGAYLIGLVCFLVSIAVRLPLVRALNAFWRHEQPDLPERTRLSGKAWVVVIIGSLAWAATVLSWFTDVS